MGNEFTHVQFQSRKLVETSLGCFWVVLDDNGKELSRAKVSVDVSHVRPDEYFPKFKQSCRSNISCAWAMVDGFDVVHMYHRPKTQHRISKFMKYKIMYLGHWEKTVYVANFFDFF